MNGPDDRATDHGQALAAADERLNRALRATDGDEVAAYDLLLAEGATEDAAARAARGSTAG